MPVLTQATVNSIPTKLQSLTSLDNSINVTAGVNPDISVNTLSGAVDPTTATVGVIGQFYINTTTDAYFVCVDSAGPYVWVASESNNLSGVIDPTTSTVGTIGQLYINTANDTAFVCTNILGGPLYTWVLISNAPSVIPALWDANTNTPTLTSGVGVLNEIYIVNVAGSTILDGLTAWQIGDMLTFNGTAWVKVGEAKTWDANTNTPTLTGSIGNEGDIYIVSVAGNTDLDGSDNWLVGQVASFTGGQWFKNPILNPNCIVFSNNLSNLKAEPSYMKFVETNGTISIYNDDTSTTYDTITINPRLSITKSSTTGESIPQLVLKTFSNINVLPSLMLLGSRGTDQSAATTLLANDRFGSIEFGGFTSVADQNNLSGAIYQTVESAVPGTLRATMNFASIDGVIMSMSSNRSTQFNDLVRVTHAFGTGAIPSSGVTDSQMFFYPRKAAFRAGQVSAAQWNNATIGQWSAAIGQNTTASGDWSFASNLNCTASGVYSTAMGLGATASLDGAIAAGGFGAVASGSASSTIGGNGNTTSGTLGVTIGGGLNSNAGTFSIILGSVGSSINVTAAVGTIAGGSSNSIGAGTTNCTAIGTLAAANHNYSIVINAQNTPLTTTAANTLIMGASGGIGLNTNSPNSSVTASGTYSSSTTTVSANFSTASTLFKNIFVNTSTTAITATLDNADCVAGREYVIKDISNNAFTNNITITPNGGKTINGLVSLTIAVNGGSVIIISTGSNWFTIG